MATIHSSLELLVKDVQTVNARLQQAGSNQIIELVLADLSCAVRVKTRPYEAPIVVQPGVFDPRSYSSKPIMGSDGRDHDY